MRNILVCCLVCRCCFSLFLFFVFIFFVIIFVEKLTNALKRMTINTSSVDLIYKNSDDLSSQQTPITEESNIGNASGNPLGNFKCMVCDKTLTSQQNLMKHLLTHNNNHTCLICMKTFKSTHFLRHHMDKHNESYEYTCPICGKKFKFKNNMRGHLRKHSMEKKFECEICHKKFIGRWECNGSNWSTQRKWGMPYLDYAPKLWNRNFDKFSASLFFCSENFSLYLKWSL